jgi:lipopolysaccharide export system permease protein
MEDLKNKYIERERMIDRNTRRHDIERHRKFTLSFACLVFFFIGAPLGAIIRKGGLGVPVVISVFLFIIYYIIDNMGYKMAREGVWHVWSGMWLSSAVLFPLGIYLTYLAATDSMISINTNFKSLFKRKKKIDTENPNFTQTSAIDEGTEDGDDESAKDSDITPKEII